MLVLMCATTMTSMAACGAKEPVTPEVTKEVTETKTAEEQETVSETVGMPNPWTDCKNLNEAEDKMVKEPLRFENGCMLIPEAPGIGVELADDAEELYPANERGSNAARRAFDGSVKDW